MNKKVFNLYVLTIKSISPKRLMESSYEDSLELQEKSVVSYNYGSSSDDDVIIM